MITLDQLNADELKDLTSEIEDALARRSMSRAAVDILSIVTPLLTELQETRAKSARWQAEAERLGVQVEQKEARVISEHELDHEASTIADTIADAVNSGDDNRPISEQVHEAVDGHQWVIYTHWARQLLVTSRFEDAMADAVGSEGMVTTDGAIDWSALAFFALEAEVNEQLTERSCSECCGSYAESPSVGPHLNSEDEPICYECFAQSVQDAEDAEEAANA